MGAGNVLAGVLISACLAVFIAIHVTGAVSGTHANLAPIAGPLAGAGPIRGWSGPSCLRAAGKKSA